MFATIIVKDSYEGIINVLTNSLTNLKNTGNIFAVFSNEYDSDRNITNSFFDVINAGTNMGYSYINTIIIPKDKKKYIEFNDNVYYMVWFVKSKKEMYFNKDAIREKHIWKDVEWGKRAKNYNPKGKDPGNVWIPTRDNGKGKITEHILLNDYDIINRIIASTTVKEDKLLLIWNNIKKERLSKDVSLTIKLPVKKSSSFINYSYKSNLDIGIEKQTSKIKGNIYFNTSEKMDKIKNNTVDLVVTSPPYWDLKDYFKKGQIGQESYKIYLKRMNSVWKQCYKKLKDSGTLWININIRVRANKPILIPGDFIKQCQNIGFLFKGLFIWHKSSGIPTHAKNIVDRHEYVLLFSKNNDYYFNKIEFNKINDYKNSNINNGVMWNINRKAGSVGKKFIHPAIYPTELINRIIKISAPEYGLVCDPFLGSGTTLIASLNNERNFAGYEYNEGFKDLINMRINNEVINKKKYKIEFK